MLKGSFLIGLYQYKNDNGTIFDLLIPEFFRDIFEASRYQLERLALRGYVR